MLEVDGVGDDATDIFCVEPKGSASPVLAAGALVGIAGVWLLALPLAAVAFGTMSAVDLARRGGRRILRRGANERLRWVRERV